MLATPPLQPLRRVEGLSSRAFWATCVAAIGAPLAGTILATGAGDVVLVALSALAAAATVAAGVHRQRVASLPLQISPKALVGRVDGWPVYRFRARLGHGRPARDVRVEVRFEGPTGPSELTPVVASLPAAVGPWTVAVVDRGARCGGPGTFAVRVCAREDGNTWEATRRFSWDTLRPGRFDAGVSRRRGRLQWDEPWDGVWVEGS